MVLHDFKKQHRNGYSLTRQTTLFSIFRSLFGPLSRALSGSRSGRRSGQRKSRRLIYKWRNNLENARTKSREQKKALRVTLIVYRNSSKKVEPLDRSGILLCRHNDFDVINGVHSNRLAREKKRGLSLSQQSSEQITQRITQYENNSYKANFLIRDTLSKGL